MLQACESVDHPAAIEMQQASPDISEGTDSAPKAGDALGLPQAHGDTAATENRTQFAAALTVCIVAGLAFGIGIGFTPFYLTYIDIGESCPLFTSDEACTTAKFGHCVWTREPGAQRVANGTILNASCKFSDFREVLCPAWTAPGVCDGASVYS
jgi:hypothetical protein